MKFRLRMRVGVLALVGVFALPLRAAFRDQVTGQGDGTLLTITMDLRPRGLRRRLAPIIRGAFQRNEVKNLANIKAQMERSDQPRQ